MSFSEVNRTTRRPVIASLASADAEFNRWVASQGYQELIDADGGTWQLKMKLEQLPHPQEIQGALFRLHIGLESTLDVRQLVEVGAFDREDDQRLLHMLGNDKVPMEMRNRMLEHSSVETLRGMLADEMVNIRKSLSKVELNEVRKRLIGQWIDRKCLFGGRLPTLSADKNDLDV
jgi:hypothetical protein